MGRYYQGDIGGKFWFGDHSGDDPSFFGGETAEPNVITYVYSEEDLPAIIEGLRKCKDALGEHRKTLDEYSAVLRGYADMEVARLLGLADGNSAREKMVWYARLELGEKIKFCVEERGSCAFETELEL